VRRGFGNGHLLGIVAWLLVATNCIITAMVAVSFGSYASAAVADSGKVWRFDSGQPNLDACYTGGTVIVNSYGILTALDARTGRRAWASKPPRYFGSMAAERGGRHGVRDPGVTRRRSCPVTDLRDHDPQPQFAPSG